MNVCPWSHDALVAGVLAAARVGLIRWPAWELERALEEVAAGDDAAARAAHHWGRAGPLGMHFDGLAGVLAELICRGILMVSDRLPGYAVDTWALDDFTAEWAPIPRSLQVGGAWLAQRDHEVRAASK